MYHYVYEITNLISNTKYIGKRSCHCSIEKDTYMGSGKKLLEAIKKYGKENFKKEIIKEFNSEREAYDFETKYIKLKDAVKSRQYYNIAEGGLGNAKGTFKGVKSPNAKKIICLNNKIIFDTVTEASEFYNCDKSDIVKCCKDKQRYAGLYKDMKLSWAYYDDYLADENRVMQRLDKDFVAHRGIYNSNSKTILCVTTGKVFSCRREAAEFYNISQIERHITSCCNGKRKSCGKLPNGTKLIWKYI